MSGSIVVMGSANTDMVLQVERMPRPGETILGGEFHQAAGGKGANQAVAAARAGGNVHFIARVGDDLFGQQAVAGYLREGINVDHVRIDDKAPSGVALIFVAADGENCIGVGPGANSRVSPEDVQRAEQCICSADVLLMDLEVPLESVKTAAEMASKAGVRVILDPAPARPLGSDILRYVSILTPDESEAELLTGREVQGAKGAADAGEKLLSLGIDTALITLGAEGVFAAFNQVRESVSGYAVNAVDTTAAGDTFNGALAVALADGKPLLEAVRFGMAAAAISVTRIGAQPSIPRLEEIITFLDSRDHGI